MPNNTAIYGIYAREILDSRAVPTIETTVILQSGYRGTASVPSGASVGTYEALELRDHDLNRYNGNGVLIAIKNIHEIIAPSLINKEATNQKDIDQTMINLDATANKSKLGANSILAVSLAVSVAAASAQRLPLYKYLNTLFPCDIKKIPTPMFNMINGGKHGDGNLDFQEYHIIPSTQFSYSRALQMGVEIYQTLKKELQKQKLFYAVGDEGGFTPDFAANIEPFGLIKTAISTTNYHIDSDISFGLDAAATQFYSNGQYKMKDRQNPYSTSELISYYQNIVSLYPLTILEDPINENGWPEWQKLMGKVKLIGDDLIASNRERLQKAIEVHACDGVVLKPNQIGTLTELLETTALAKKNNLTCILSHRSGETNDAFIADLAVAIQADFVKFGAPARGERVAKYNRLLQIEKELIL